MHFRQQSGRQKGLRPSPLLNSPGQIKNLPILRPRDGGKSHFQCGQTRARAGGIPVELSKC